MGTYTPTDSYDLHQMPRPYSMPEPQDARAAYRPLDTSDMRPAILEVDTPIERQPSLPHSSHWRGTPPSSPPMYTRR